MSLSTITEIQEAIAKLPPKEGSAIVEDETECPKAKKRPCSRPSTEQRTNSMTTGASRWRAFECGFAPGTPALVASFNGYPFGNIGPRLGGSR
jgi:hypothetical protein